MIAQRTENAISLIEADHIDNLLIDICSIRLRMEELPRHRSYSLAMTKLEESEMWLKDRKNKPV
jgi:hypothetical protein